MALLEYRNISKKYGSLQALDSVNLDIPEGRIVGLLGPNGSGKSTLIKITAGLLVPDSGTVTVAGVPVGEKTKATVSYLPEQTYLHEWMKVKDFLSYFQEFYSDFDRAKAEDMLTALGVDKNLVMKTLSKGTKEKVQLVLVMSRRARLYLLDEPIAGVDPAARDYILRTIIGNYSAGSSVIISTHLILDIEEVLDDVVFIDRGTIRLADEADELRAKHQTDINSLFKEVFRC